MNKLISKNPILRFKLGRKIGKFQNPGSTLPVLVEKLLPALYKLLPVAVQQQIPKLPATVLKQLPSVILKFGAKRALGFLSRWLGPTLVAGYGAYTTEEKRQERNSNMQKNLSRWYLAGRANDRNTIWADRTSGKLYKGKMPAAMNELELADYMKNNLIGDSYSGYDITKIFSNNGPSFTINGRDYMFKQKLGTKAPYDLSPEAKKIIAERDAKRAALNNTVTKTDVSTKTPIKTSPIFNGVRVGGNVKDFDKAITRDLKAQLINSKGFTEDDFKDTLTFQNALNRYFGKNGYGSIKTDGLWGNQTQNAFNLALKKAKAPVVNTTLGVVILDIKPISPITKPDLNVKVDIPKLNTLNRSFNYNKSQIRDLISKGGFNPYNYTGAQRKALRMYLNGESDDTSLLDGTDLARFTLPYKKKGGNLPSRNVIERFKSKINKN